MPKLPLPPSLYWILQGALHQYGPETPEPPPREAHLRGPPPAGKGRGRDQGQGGGDRDRYYTNHTTHYHKTDSDALPPTRPSRHGEHFLTRYQHHSRTHEGHTTRTALRQAGRPPSRPRARAPRQAGSTLGPPRRHLMRRGGRSRTSQRGSGSASQDRRRKRMASFHRSLRRGSRPPPRSSP